MLQATKTVPHCTDRRLSRPTPAFSAPLAGMENITGVAAVLSINRQIYRLFTVTTSILNRLRVERSQVRAKLQYYRLDIHIIHPQ